MRKMMQPFPGYHIIELLHEGTTSLVYRAYRQASGRSVILKVLKDAYPPPETIAWFKREYDILGMFSHAGVVQAYGLETNRYHWFIVLEDFGGDSLSRLGVEGTGRLVDSLNLAISVTETIGHIHQRQVIHKDLNPSNIVLNPTTQQVKLIDFGIATVLSRENPAARSPNVLEGTLAYMSPEQTGRMNRTVDYRTDFYSLGTTLYELLTGQPPFVCYDALELVHSHIARHPPPPHELRPDIPPALSAVILKLMEKNAEDRYQSAYGIRADLEQIRREVTGNWSEAVGERGWESIPRRCPRSQVFVPGQYDIPDRFSIPQKLYGREHEVTTLLAAFERACRGARGMMLMTGPAGVGKSALVQEIYKPVTYRRGYVISGKFDQFQRDIPYSAFIQAFRSLVQQLLTESERRIASWRQRLLEALGPGGQVIIDVIPEIALIIGPQPEIPALGPSEAHQRFNLVFQQFIRVFTHPEHPLVILLDDLQWADRASLKLLELLMTESLTGSVDTALLVVGAYRDNEVGADHPLRATLDTIARDGGDVQSLRLAPLERCGVLQLVQETLHCPGERVSPLADLVLNKTGGNPFFLQEFFRSLYLDGFLWFSYETGRWQWDVERIQSQEMTDNVVELLTTRVQRLHEPTRVALTLAACLGNPFEVGMLAALAHKASSDIAGDLEQAVAEGLVVPLGGGRGGDGAGRSKLATMGGASLGPENGTTGTRYIFAHDRIRQTIYSLIDEPVRQAFHWRTGRLFLEQYRGNHSPDQGRGETLSPSGAELAASGRSTGTSSPVEYLFDMVHHLNQGWRCSTSQAERDELAALNLLAGQRAKASAAYGPALHYLERGLSLTAPDSWQHQYQLTLDLHVEAAEAAYLNGEFEKMEHLAAVVLQRARSVLDKVRAYEVKIMAAVAQNRQQEAIRLALSVLHMVRVHLPQKPNTLHMLYGLAATRLALGRRTIEDLIDLPAMQDPYRLAAVRIITRVATAIYVTAPQLLALTALNLIGLSFRYGNAPATAFAHASYAVILCGVVGDINAGYRFGHLALRLLERYQAREFQARTLVVVKNFIAHWKEHLRDTIPSLLEAYQSGLETGDFHYAALAAYMYSNHLYLVGRPLSETEQTMQTYSEAIGHLNQETALHWNELYRQVVLNLMGRSAHPCRLVGEAFDEERQICSGEDGQDGTGLYLYYVNKLILCYLFQDYPQAFEHATRAERYVQYVISSPQLPFFYLYDSLTRLALIEEAAHEPHGSGPPEPQEASAAHLRRVAANQRKLKRWARHAPMNYLHKFALVEAERCRVEGQGGEAREQYDRAIGLAREHGYLNEEALACELAARFYQRRGQTSTAALYLRDAHYLYRQWEARAKVRDLEARYPSTLGRQRPQGGNGRGRREPEEATAIAPPSDPHRTEPGLSPAITTSSPQASHLLDMTSVVKASQAISNTIILPTLLSQMIRIVMENAGARRGVIILDKAGTWTIEAEGTIDAETSDVAVLQSIPIEASAPALVPTSIVNYVSRTMQSVVLHHACQEGAFTYDPYIAAHCARSILCFPLIHQRRLIGMLYLENHAATGAFTPERLEVLNLLSSQVAISIENAVLYTSLEQKEEKYRTLFEHSKDTIFITDPDGRIVDINPAGLDLFGYEREEILALNAVNLYANPHDRPTFQQTMVEQGAVRDYEITFRRKDGNTIACLVTSSVRLAEDGAIAGYHGIIRDITAQKQAEVERAALLDRYARTVGELKAIVRSMADGVLAVDVDETIVMVNPVAATLLGRNAADLLAQPLEALMEVDDPVLMTNLHYVVEQIRRKLDQPDEPCPEERLSLGERIVRLQTAPTRGSRQSLTGVVVVIQDITRAVEAERAKNTFLATASHEMRTPLASMKGFLDIFYLGGIDNLTDNQRMFLNTLKRQTDHLIQLVNDLLEMTRLEQKAVRAERRWVAIETAIEEALVSLRPEMERRHIDLHIKLEPDLPRIWIDPLHLRRILTNLLSNAVKYVQEGGEVRVWAYELHKPLQIRGTQVDEPWRPREKRSVVVEVEDNGVGIRSEDQHQIFSRFFRSGNPRSTEAGGSGLGLAITRSLVQLHQGQIGFWSVEREGTCFWVRLPAPTTEPLEDVAYLVS